MASLTKIMTALVSIKIAQELNLDWNNTYFIVSSRCAGCLGTTAFLIQD